MKKKVFVFDFDGTLASTDLLIGYSIYYAYKKVTNKEIDFEEIYRNYGPNEEGIFKNILKDERNAKLTFYYYLEFYKDLQEKYLPLIDKKFIEIFEDIKNSGHDLILLTGRSLETALMSLDYFRIKDYFKDIYFGSSEGVNKPISFKRMMKDYGYKTSDILYIGDSYNDVNSCKEVGVDLISALYYSKNSEKVKKANPNFVTTIDELKEKIKDYY